MGHRAVVAATVVALVAGGCGLLQQPSVSTTEEVQQALAGLGEDGLELRLTAEVVVDTAEVRRVAMADDDLRALLEDEYGDEDTTATAVKELQQLQAQLERYAATVLVGADGSFGVTVDGDGTTLGQVRQLQELDPDDPLAAHPLELQLGVDLDAIAALVDDPLFDLDVSQARRSLDGDGFTEAIAAVPALERTLPLLEALLGGDLVAVTGTYDAAAMLASFEELAGGMPGVDLGAMLEQQQELLDPAELAGLEDAVVHDGFRLEDGVTVVDVSVAPRKLGTLVVEMLELSLEASAGALSGPGVTDELRAEMTDELDAELDGMRDHVSELPELLADVGQLRFGPDGVLQQFRLDLAGLALQLAAGLAPDDEDLATMAAAATQLRTTGVFAVADVVATRLPTALATPVETLTWDDVQAIVDDSATAMFTPSANDDPWVVEALALYDGLALRPGDVAVGECFNHGALEGSEALGGTAPFDCGEPHGYEAYAEVMLGVGDLPYDPGKRLEYAFAECDHNFWLFTGGVFYEHGYAIDVLFPSAEEWAEGERVATCFLFKPEETLVGSLEGRLTDVEPDPPISG